jgi:hypothetical protein
MSKIDWLEDWEGYKRERHREAVRKHRNKPGVRAQHQKQHCEYRKRPEVREKRRKREREYLARFDVRKRTLLHNAKDRAKERDRPFSITMADIEAAWPKDNHCPVLGIPFQRGNARQCENSPTLDEVIIGNGYVPGNIAVISWRANALKRNGSLEELERLTNWLFEFHMRLTDACGP